jgi:predicted PurR-regulated permease PerM
VNSEDRQGTLGFRLGRLWNAAEFRKVPLRTIIVALLAITFFFLAGKLIYRLRDVVLLLLVAGFAALILNPLVRIIQRYVVRRRGLAVVVVTLLSLCVFAGLAFAFGYPLVNAITNLANRLPSYIKDADSGRGWLGHLLQRYHVQRWVTQNAPKLVTFGQDLSKPALAIGEGAASLIIELLTIFVLMLLLLLEGPRLRRGILSVLSPAQAREVTAVASEVNRAVVGYMLGNFTTSVVCGLTIFITLTVTGVPFPGLWALWVALVDFLPMIGGALAGIPVVLFAAAQSITAGVVTLIVFLVYTQVENHVLNPIIMSKTVRISPLLVLVSVLVGASLGSWVGGIFGGFVAALLAIPAAGAFQVIVREIWRLTGPAPGQVEMVEAQSVTIETTTVETTTSESAATGTVTVAEPAESAGTASAEPVGTATAEPAVSALPEPADSGHQRP